jgi:hypothetical protein
MQTEYNRFSKKTELLLCLQFNTIFMAISSVWSTHTHFYSSQFDKLHPTASPQTTPNSFTTNYTQQLHHKLHPTASPQTTPTSFTTNYAQQLHHKIQPAASPQPTPNSFTTNYAQQLHHKLHPAASPRPTPNNFTTTCTQQLHDKLRPTALPQTTPNSFTTNYNQQLQDKHRHFGSDMTGLTAKGKEENKNVVHLYLLEYTAQAGCYRRKDYAVSKTTVRITQNWNTLQPEHNLSLKKWCG